MFGEIKCSKEHCPYSGNINIIEKKIEELFTNCCSSDNMKQGMRTNLLLEQVILKIERIEKDIVANKKEYDKKYMVLLENVRDELSVIKKENETFRRYFHYFIGAVSIIYFLGLDDKISKMIFGG